MVINAAFLQKSIVLKNQNIEVSVLIPRCQFLDFEIAFKMCRIKNHNNVAQKLKEMRDIHQSKIELEKNIYIKTVQTLQGLRHVYQ